ncbi:hypothetical protein LXL04_022936 [Taraxacum kok-saghyz]
MKSSCCSAKTAPENAKDEETCANNWDPATLTDYCARFQSWNLLGLFIDLLGLVWATDVGGWTPDWGGRLWAVSIPSLSRMDSSSSPGRYDGKRRWNSSAFSHVASVMSECAHWTRYWVMLPC